MLKNIVAEQSNAPGTATTINLGGALPGRVTWRASGFTTGASVFYFMEDGTQSEWGLGTLTLSSPDTLTRTTVLGNSAGTTTRLNFTTFTRVYNSVPAERAVWQQGSLALADGAVGTPSLSMATDPDTGIYFPATAEIAIALAGVQKLRISAAGVLSDLAAPTDPKHLAPTSMIRRPVVTHGTAGFGTSLSVADLASDRYVDIIANSSFILPALSGVAAGTRVTFINAASSTAGLTLEPDGSETIEAFTNLTIYPGESVDLIATASKWLAVGIPLNGWRTLLTQEASNVAQLDFVLPSEFNVFRIEVANLRAATDGGQLALRTSTDGGSSFAAGATDYTNAGFGLNSGGIVSTVPANANSIILGPGVDTGDTTFPISSVYEYFPGTASLSMTLYGHTHIRNNALATLDGQGRWSRRSVAGRTNAFRCLFSTGNISSGRISLLGRR